MTKTELSVREWNLTLNHAELTKANILSKGILVELQKGTTEYTKQNMLMFNILDKDYDVFETYKIVPDELIIKYQKSCDTLFQAVSKEINKTEEYIIEKHQ